jgi:hypothetical protein
MGISRTRLNFLLYLALTFHNKKYRELRLNSIFIEISDNLIFYNIFFDIFIQQIRFGN